MGSLGGEEAGRRRPRFLCLHGFRTSAEIMRKQVLGKWPADVTARLDLVFADAPFPAEGKSDVKGIFDPPYYEWFQFDKETELFGVQEFRQVLGLHRGADDQRWALRWIDGFLPGAILSAALPGLQEQHTAQATALLTFLPSAFLALALTRVPKIKYLIIIGELHQRSPTRSHANKITCPSLHFIGDNDFLKVHGESVIESCVDPFVIRHPKGHTVPRLVRPPACQWRGEGGDAADVRRRAGFDDITAGCDAAPVPL